MIKKIEDRKSDLAIAPDMMVFSERARLQPSSEDSPSLPVHFVRNIAPDEDVPSLHRKVLGEPVPAVLAASGYVGLYGWESAASDVVTPKTHHCPGCETNWNCTTPDNCKLDQCLCDDCDNLEVRTRLGGVWID